MPRLMIGAGVCALMLTSLGCHSPADTSARTEQPDTGVSQNTLLADAQRIGWDHLGQKAQGFDQVAEGPNAVAVAPDGSTLVLDRLQGRVLKVTDGAPREVAQVEQDVEDISVGPDGALVAYSPLRAKAWVFAPDGTPAGSVDIPRAIRSVWTVDLGVSRTVLLRTMHQETLTVGSPNAPLDLPVAMKTKKEGAYQLSDGRGVSAVVRDGKAQLLVVRQGQGRERARTDVAHELSGQAKAVRVVGVTGTVACMRVEEVESTPTISVSRRAVCMDAVSGNVTFSAALPPKGTYLPRRELAVGAGHLAFMYPTPDGLAVKSFRVTGSVTGAPAAGSEEVSP